MSKLNETAPVPQMEAAGHLIGYDFFRKPFQVQIDSTPVDLASINLIQHNGLVHPRRLSAEETQAMFDSIDKGAPNVDVASFLFGLLNDARGTNISVAPMNDAEPVEGILYCNGEVCSMDTHSKPLPAQPHAVCHTVDLNFPYVPHCGPVAASQQQLLYT